MTAILPLNIDFVTWAQQLRDSYPDEPIPIINYENQWQDFYNLLLYNRCFQQYQLPNVDGFDNWRDWAAQFLLAIGA